MARSDWASNTKEIQAAAQRLRSSPDFRQLTDLLKKRLEDARNDYEETIEASYLEFNRGRVVELKTLLTTLSVENP